MLHHSPNRCEKCRLEKAPFASAIKDQFYAVGALQPLFLPCLDFILLFVLFRTMQSVNSVVMPNSI